MIPRHLNPLISFAATLCAIVVLGIAAGSAPAIAQCTDAWRTTPGNIQLNHPANAFVSSSGMLYVGGSFSSAGGNSASNIAAWDGSNWQAMGSGVSSTVNALIVYAGTIVAGGDFSTAGGLPARGIARWNGANWLNDVGLGNAPGSVRALAAFDGKLIAGGNFTTVNGTNMNHIAMWNGSGWQSMGFGLDGPVEALLVQGTTLYAGGEFTGFVAQWTGSVWQTVGSGISGVGPHSPLGVFALATFNNQLVAAGQFDHAGTSSAASIAIWTGSSWQGLGTGFGGGSTLVYALTTRNGRLFAGGEFETAGGNPIPNIAQWNGSWLPVGTGLDSNVTALSQFNGDLVAGGWFSSSGGTPAAWCARFGPPRPTVTMQPTNVAICTGGNANFFASGSGNGNIFYRWRRGSTELTDNTHVAGSGTAHLVINGCTSSDIDTHYNCKITDACSASSFTNFVQLDVTPTATVQAGGPYLGCWMNPVHLNGNASNYSSVQWSSSGTGTFSNPAGLAPDYFPSEADAGAGSVVLTLAVSGINGCSPTNSTANLTMPFPPNASTGGPYSACGMVSVALTGSASHQTSVQWTSSGSGTFTAPNNLSTMYHPSSADVTSGTITLTLRANGMGSCGFATDSKLLALYRSATGDSDGNGRADGQDIAKFVRFLVVGGFTSPGYCGVDMNGDGVVTMADVQPFISRLLGA